jgi:hypothetical protein
MGANEDPEEQGIIQNKKPFFAKATKGGGGA